MKKYILIVVISFLSITYGIAQDFRMTDGSFVTCSGSFTDSGGLTSDYTNDEGSVITFCSPFATDDMQVTFNSFNLASGDFLIVYDGDTAMAPILGVFLGANSPGIVTSSATNASGCLTFRFRSDASNVSSGWEATIACIDNCQTITSSVTTTPAPDADGILRICQGETVNFNGTSNFSMDATGATFNYILSDGSTVSGTTATETFNNPGIYRIDFVATDNMGCRDRSIGDASDVLIQVSTTPDFTGTEASDTSICFGESTDITGMVETTEFFADVAPPITGQTFLPDGPNDPQYQTCIDVQGFPVGATFQSASDLVDIFIDMEHSWVNDLEIILSAPDGSEIVLLSNPNQGGGIFFGIPIDPGPGPGTGFVYSFTERSSATQTIVQALPALNNGDSVPAGDYLPEDPFSSFIGTPLNGLWCLTITDFLASDDGYIFEWGMNFNPAIIPTAGSYEPGEVSEMWEANADITATNGNVITVTPTTSGQHCYNYSFTDSFGCTYTETVCIEVAPEITSVEPNDIIICDQVGTTAQIDLTARNAQILNGLDPALYTVVPYGNQADADSENNAITNPTMYNVSASQTVVVRVQEIATGCFKTVELDIDYSTAVYNGVPDLDLCDDPVNADGMEVFDLTSQDSDILGSQSAAEFMVNYFLNQNDADANTNPILTPAAFESMGETIYARVSNIQDPDCYTTGIFDLVVNEVPNIGTATDITECDESPIDGATSFDFSVNDPAILDGQSATAYTVSYYTSQTDAEVATGAISTTSTVAGGTIYARIENNLTGCYNTSTFNFIVETCEVEVPEGFSPNNDGINDTFSIPGIDQFENFELKVFNRLGAVVYETRATNYVEFAGIPNTGISSGDGLLPVGTYFYVIKFNDPDTEDVASWLYINY